jgi:hypothetical protein
MQNNAHGSSQNALEALCFPNPLREAKQQAATGFRPDQ